MKRQILFSFSFSIWKKAQFLITEEMVKTMKPGSYILDLSIDQGGNCELTKRGEVIEVNGVKIDGTTNVPSMIQQVLHICLRKIPTIFKSYNKKQ